MGCRACGHQIVKVLFVSSNPKSESGLNLEAELTELDAILASSVGEPCLLVVRAGLPIEKLASTIQKERPDVLHITAHGEDTSLSMQNASGDAVALQANNLIDLIGDEMPSLIYLNACNSDKIALALTEHVGIAIGSDAPISNRAARAAAVVFYQRLVVGKSVLAASRAAKATLSALEDGSATLVLHKKNGVDPSKVSLHTPPTLTAHILSKSFQPSQRKFDVRFGVLGCPRNISQVVFFTDDNYFLGDGSTSWADDLCQVNRNQPNPNGFLKSNRDDIWQIKRDHRVVAAGLTSDGKTFCAVSKVSDALIANLLVSREGNDDVVRQVSQALRLRT